MIAAAPVDHAAPVRRDTRTCPHCGTATGVPTLLTSMTRYYACVRCAARWSVARNWREVAAPRTA